MKPNRNKWKGRKWISTPFAKKYRAASAAYRVMAASILSVHVSNVGKIRSFHPQSSFQKAEKAISIAASAVNAFGASSAMMREFDKNYGHMRAKNVKC